MIQARGVRERFLSRAFTIALGIGIGAISYGLWQVPLRWYLITLDDFDYLSRSRNTGSLLRHLFTPHAGHVVPLFRLETHLLCRMAGSLEALPGVLGTVCFGTLLAAMMLTGLLVARETGRPERGLAAMAAVGFSSVLGPSVLWYAASQALACGAMILAMLAALQLWRVRGAAWVLVLGLLAAIAAPVIWTAGYIAGPVGAAFLLADGRRRCRKAAVLPLAVSVVCWVVVHVFLIRYSGEALAGGGLGVIWDQMRAGIVRGVVHSAQAFCELVFKSFGLDTATTGSQAIVIVLCLAGTWFWSRTCSDSNGTRRWPRINPLEAAGAVMIACSLGLIYTVRGTLGNFEELRTQGWYDAVALLGTVLFVFGWWAGPIESPPAALEYSGRGRLLESVLVVAVIFVLQAPRVERVIYRYDGMGAWPGPDAPSHPPILTLADLERRARDQRHNLAALDGLERRAREGGLTRGELEAALRNALSERALFETGGVVRLVELLDIPERSKRAD